MNRIQLHAVVASLVAILCLAHRLDAQVPRVTTTPPPKGELPTKTPPPPKNLAPAQTQAIEQLLREYRDMAELLRRNNHTEEFDALNDKMLQKYPNELQLWGEIASTLNRGSYPHHGVLEEGKYIRGKSTPTDDLRRDSSERDRVRALQIMQQALPVVAKAPASSEKRRFYSEFARLLERTPSYDQLWYLQHLTDLTWLPPYEKRAIRFGDRRVGIRPMPEDEQGQPIFYQLPASWETAKNDGERRLWLLEQARLTLKTPTEKQSFQRDQAQFAQQWYEVQRAARLGELAGTGILGAEENKPDDGPLSVYSLAENETILRLPSGFKRVKLPPELNAIKLLTPLVGGPQESIGDGTASQFQRALTNVPGDDRAQDLLSQIWENRHHFGLAAEYSIRTKSYPEEISGNLWKNRRSQNLEPYGEVEDTLTYPAGKPVEFYYKYRNATAVTFTLQKLNVERWLRDVKKQLQDGKAIAYRQRHPNYELSDQITRHRQLDYLEADVAKWTLKLDPPADHFDRRISISLPTDKPGAYLLWAQTHGHLSATEIWITDTVIVNYPLEQTQLYQVLDATSGKPVPQAKVEFLGYSEQRELKPLAPKPKPGEPDPNPPTASFEQFEELTDEQGFVRVDNERLKQREWFVSARTAEGRWAHLGFDLPPGFYLQPPRYEAKLPLVVFDRNVYYAGETVHFRYWPASAPAQKDQVALPIKNVQVEIFPFNQKEPLYSQQLKVNEFGRVQGEVKLPENPRGLYELKVDGQTQGRFYTNALPKRPALQAQLQLPGESVVLGDKFHVKLHVTPHAEESLDHTRVRYFVLRDAPKVPRFPESPWDSLYGPGYGWLGIDYPWYPGWHDWGFTSKLPVRLKHNREGTEILLEDLRPLDAAGELLIPVDTRPIQQLDNQREHWIYILAEIIPPSGNNTVVGEKILIGRRPFQVTTSLDRGHYRPGENVNANIRVTSQPQQPLAAQGEWQLLRIQYTDDKPIEEPVAQGNVSSNALGEAALKFVAPVAGQYRLSVVMSNAGKAKAESGCIFTVYDGKPLTDQARYDFLELIPDRATYKPGDKVRLLVNTAHEDATVALLKRPLAGPFAAPQVVTLQGKSGIVELDVSPGDLPCFHLEAYTIHAGLRHTAYRRIAVPEPVDALRIKLDPSAASLRPELPGNLKLRVTDDQDRGHAAEVMVAVIDPMFEQRSSIFESDEERSAYWKWHSLDGQSSKSSLGGFSGNYIPESPWMQHRGVFRDLSSPSRFPTPAAIRLEQAAKSESGRGVIGYFALEHDVSNKPSLNMIDMLKFQQRMWEQDQPSPTLFFGDLRTNVRGELEFPITLPAGNHPWRIVIWAKGQGTNLAQAVIETGSGK